MKRYIVEFIGTFFLVLVIAMTGNPVAIGAILIAMVYLGGYISGAHYNPAVTLAIVVRGKMIVGEAVKYIVSQVLGATFAAVVFFAVKGTTFTPKPVTSDFFIATLGEIIFTFALASVVLHVATSEETKGNQYYGLAIGLTVMAGAFVGGPISGGVYNPAVAIGPMLVDIKNVTTNLPNLFMYLVGPVTGAALAAVVYNYVHSPQLPVVEETDVVLDNTSENLEEM